MSDEREAGVLFRRGDSVYWIPDASLGDFELPADQAGELIEELDEESEVEGFANLKMGDIKTLSWGFEGSFGLKGGSKVWNGEHLEYLPPPPPPKAMGR